MLSAMGRQCAWCRRVPMVACIKARGRWARRAHRVRVYPLVISVELEVS